MNIHIIAPVWGPRYVETFVHFSLPSQLAGRNLGCFPKDAVYEIMTTSESLPSIKTASSVLYLQTVCQVKFTIIDNFDFNDHPYIIMTECYNKVLQDAGDYMVDTAFFFLTSDIIWSNGSFKKAMDILHSGKRAVMVDAGLHVILEQFVPEFRKTFVQNNAIPINCPPRQLLELAFGHLHDLTKSMLWGNCMFHNMVPAHVYWMESDRYMLGRSWVLHPMAVRPTLEALSTDESGKYTSPIDHEFVRMVCPCFDDVYICCDSDQILAVEMSHERHLRETIFIGKVTTGKIAAWLAREWVNPYHKKYASSCIWFHTREILPPVVENLVNCSNAVMKRIQFQMPLRLLAYRSMSLIKKIIPTKTAEKLSCVIHRYH